jgi:tetratricopeptide (TPR) repeat protein
MQERSSCPEPSTAIAYLARGDLKRTAGDPDGAIADLTTAIRLNPRLLLAYLARGNAHRNRGETRAAIGDFTRAIRLDARSAPAYVGRGMARSQVGEAGALRDFGTAIRLDPKSAEAFFGRGWARFSAGDAVGAISDLTKAIALNPEHSVAFMLRGEAYRSKGETDRAINDLTMAIKLGVPDWGHAYGQRGVELLRKGDHKGAFADLTKAIGCHGEERTHSGVPDPKVAALHLALGTALIGLGKPQRAITELNSAVQMDSSLQQLACPLLRRAGQEVATAKQRKTASTNPRRQSRGEDGDAAFMQWEKRFRKEAKADGYGYFEELLAALELEDFTPAQVLEDTIDLVRFSLAFSIGLDGRSPLPFLQLQEYYPSRSLSARYCLTFNLQGCGIGRLLETSNFKDVDLADLYGQRHDKYKRFGYSDLWIQRTDHKQFGPAERQQIERYVREDLYFDYGVDEIDVCIGTVSARCMLVQIQDSPGSGKA